MNTTNLNTTLFTLDMIAQFEATKIIDTLDKQYQTMFGIKMSRKSREKAFKLERDELFSYYLESSIPA